MIQRKTASPRPRADESALDPKTPTSQQHQIQPSDAPRLAFEGADLGPGMGREFPLRLELVLNPDGGDDNPIVVLSDAGRGSRVLLGRITTGHHSSAHYVAVKLQTPRPPYDASEDLGGLLTHKVREKRWQRELAHYLATAGIDQGFTPLFFVEQAPERTGQTDRPRSWQPLVLCAHRKVLFNPVTERGTQLVTCRDEALLREHGLPSYSGSAETFLYNKDDIADGAAPVFYQLTLPGESQYPNAKSFEDLLRTQALLKGLPNAEVPSFGSPEDVAKFSRLATQFTCLTCPHREPCYTDGAFYERLKPFALEDSNALVLELNQYHFDEYCDLIGGIDWKSFQKQYLGPGSSPGQIFRLRDTEQLIYRGRRYMFGTDPSGMDALEIFKLKWTLFTQACQSVFEYHRRCGVAHLRVEPRHLMIRMDSVGDALPTMWQFQTRLISLGSPSIETKPEEGETGEILSLPMNSSPVYDAEIVRNSSFGIIQRGKFILTEIEPAEQGGNKFVINAEIHHDGLSMAWLSLKDRIKVILRHVVGTSDLSFFALRDPDKDFTTRLLSIRSHPIELSQQQVDALKRIFGVPFHNAGFVLYPLFHVPCDVFSLGMLLFRTLLVNDKQAMGDLSLALEGLKLDLASMAAVECEESMESAFWEALLDGHRRHKVADIFNRMQVFYNEDDRVPERPNAIPTTIWNEALVLGLQMVTSIEGFSVCSNHGDYDPRYPAGKMEPVIRRSVEILRKIDTALLAMSRYNAEIRAALESVITETMV